MLRLFHHPEVDGFGGECGELIVEHLVKGRGAVCFGHGVHARVQLRHQLPEILGDGGDLPHEHAAVPQILPGGKIALCGVQIRLFHKAVHLVHAAGQILPAPLELDVAVAGFRIGGGDADGHQIVPLLCHPDGLL